MNCTGLLGLVDCLLNDVVKLGGTVLGQLPLVNGVVAQLDGNGIQSLSNQSNVVYISPDRPLGADAQQRRHSGERTLRLGVELHRRGHRSGADR